MTEKKRIGGIIHNYEIISIPKVLTIDDRIVQGNIFGDTRWKDGTLIKTSRVVDIKGELLETLNTFYRLGDKKIKENEKEKSKAA